MAVYDFRLRFNLPEAYRVDSDEEEIELITQPDECVRLRSGVSGTPIKDHARAVVMGGPYASQDQARTAAEKSKKALLCWAIEQRVGIDFGDGKQRSFVTNEGLAMLQRQYGRPFRNDIHGIDVYEHVENLMFASVDANATVGKHPVNLVVAFRREYLSSRQLTERQMLASEIYASSFFDMSARSRFITLVTAVEALLEPQKRSDEVQRLVDEFQDMTRQQTIDEPTKESIVGSLQWLRHQSIGEAGRTLAGRLVPQELFDGQSPADFFTRCYDLRSQILHRGTIPRESVDTRHLANVMETFVARLLIEALNSEPQRCAAPDAETDR